MCPLSQEARELATPITLAGPTALPAREPRNHGEELVTYCLATKQSEVTVQHRPGLMSLVVEETQTTPSTHHHHYPGAAAEGHASS